jgi:uncharacterized protein YbaR (Trm112 family)
VTWRTGEHRRLAAEIPSPARSAARPLHADDEACEPRLHQRRCGLAYPVRDDIPVLLVSEARDPAAS